MSQPRNRRSTSSSSIVKPARMTAATLHPSSSAPPTPPDFRPASGATSGSPDGWLRALFVLWTTYGSFYFCRVNIGPAVPSIRHALGFSALEIGVVLGTIKLGYAVGQLVNGQLTERFGPRRILAVGMLGSAVVTLLMACVPVLAGTPAAQAGGMTTALGRGVWSAGHAVGLELAPSPALALMMLFAFANGWFQASGWPACVKIAGGWFPIQRRGRIMGILGTSYTVGSAMAILAVGVLLHAFHAWQIAFVAPAAVLALSFVHTALRLREAPLPPSDGYGAPSPAAPARMAVGDSLRATLGNPRIWVLAFGLFGLDAVRYGFLDWAPGHLAELHGSALQAAIKTAVFPLAGALGTLSSGWLTDRFFQSRRAPVCALLLVGVGLL